ncbi:contact-dependent growth inhibition system immunity protein [Streptomyces sp. NPDC003015]
MQWRRPRSFTAAGPSSCSVPYTALFHQDWIYDGPTAADVVAKHLGEASDEEVLAVQRDAQALLDHLPSETLEVLWTAGTQYIPSFERITGSEWTRTASPTGTRSSPRSNRWTS